MSNGGLRTVMQANKPAQQDDVLSTDATFVNAFNKAVAVFLPISACVAVALSVAFLVLFRRFAKVRQLGLIEVGVGGLNLSTQDAPLPRLLECLGGLSIGGGQQPLNSARPSQTYNENTGAEH